ncbi:MAG: PEP-CTERM sorting domain-containing protein [Spirulina sp.]
MLAFKPKLSLLAVATCSLSLVATSVQAGILFNESQTGIELFNNPNVTFPAAAPVINGSSIDVAGALSHPTNREALLVWDLLPSANRGDLDISITIDYTPISSDSDPRFGIFDGSNYLGLVRIDNNGGSIQIERGSATTTGLEQPPVTEGTPLTGIGSVQPYSFNLWIADGGAGPASLNNFVEGANSATGPFVYQGNFLDTDNPLSLVLYESDSEQYKINSLAVMIEEKDVPEPSMVLGTLAILGLGFMGRRDKGN